MAEFRFIGDPRANGHGPATLELFGLTFGRDDWTKVPDEVAERAESHSHLEMRGGGLTAFGRGAKAKADGKARSVPPAYRGKPEGERWLAGYDGVSDEVAD